MRSRSASSPDGSTRPSLRPTFSSWPTVGGRSRATGLVLLLALVGCGGGGASDPSDTDAADASGDGTFSDVDTPDEAADAVASPDSGVDAVTDDVPPLEDAHDAADDGSIDDAADGGDTEHDAPDDAATHEVDDGSQAEDGASVDDADASADGIGEGPDGDDTTDPALDAGVDVDEDDGRDIGGEAPEPFCGDGIVQAGEQCDDGNDLNADGCDVNCRREPWMEQRRFAATALGNRFVYDAARGQVLVFGGDGTRATNETALWTGTEWVHAPAGHGGGAVPPARVGMGVAYDAARREVVLFGGMGAGALADTWIWNGAEWRSAPPTSGPSPSPRVWAGMTYDAARERVVLYGGQSFHEWNPANSPTALSFTQTDDVWEWDGVRWTHVEPVAGTGPGARSFHAMTYDPVAGRVLVHGGLVGLTTQEDLWAWDGVGWQEVPLDGVRLYQHAMLYDPFARRLLLSGGGSATVFGFSPSAELREVRDGVLQPLAATDRSQAGHLLAADTLRQEIVIPREPTQVLRGDTLSTPDRTAPTGFAACYDALRGRTVLYHGSVEEFDGERWHEVAGSTGPPVPVSDRTTDRFPMVYDEARGVSVLFALGETWEWDGERWHERTPDLAPSRREGARMAYDRDRSLVVLFGGVDADGALDDTWTWDGEAWRWMEPIRSPSPRFNHAMAFDAVRGRTVLFGGETGEETGSLAVDVLGDTWEWDGEAWHQRLLPVAPSPRRLAAMVYDPFTGTVLLRGGRPDTFGWLADFWELDAEGWRKRAVWQPEPVGGSPRGFAAGVMAYHNTTATLVSAGGLSSSTSIPSADSTIHYRFAGHGTLACRTGFDGDHDGRIGCDDPDCWGWCTPLCPPDAPCDPDSPRCGDGVCNPDLETYRLCPEDCAPEASLCGDFQCDDDEDAETCPGDCAG